MSENLMPGRYLTFSCSLLIMSVRFCPSIDSWEGGVGRGRRG